MLLRVFMGWPRGERGHFGMVAVPTIEEEEAKRPHRERENLVGERTRINRMKAALVWLGIRGFKPELRRALKAGLHPHPYAAFLYPPSPRFGLVRDLGAAKC